MNRLYLPRLLAGIAAALAATAAPAAAPEPTLDLPAAINLAMERNRDLVLAAKRLRGGALDVTAARLGFSTHLRPEGSGGLTEDGSTGEYGLRASKAFVWGTKVSVGARVTTTDNEDVDDFHRAAVDVQITQPLFRNAGRLMNEESVRQADSALTQARRGHEEQKASLVVQVAETFVRIIQLRRQIRFDGEVLQRTDKLHRLTKARESQGHATRVDALRVDLQLGEARLRLANTRENLSTTERLFAELLGAPPDKTFELEPPPLLELKIPAVTDAVAIALENRLDYAQAIQDGGDRARAVRIARRNLYPDISLRAGVEKFGEGTASSDAYKLDQDSWFLGLAASTDFNRSQERIGLEKAVFGEESARDIVKIKELSIARDVKERLDFCRRAQTDIAIAERNLGLAEGRAKLARRLFEAGRGDNFSATDAEDAHVQAQSRLLQARADASLSGYRLLHALGTLTEFPEELKPKQAPRE